MYLVLNWLFQIVGGMKRALYPIYPWCFEIKIVRGTEITLIDPINAPDVYLKKEFNCVAR